VPSRRRVLPPDANGPRFRIVRLWTIGTVTKAEVIDSAETPSESMIRVFAEPFRTLAVDRRGDVYTDNHKPIQERT